MTDIHGMPVQYIMYAPYGESLLNQQASTYNERFKFTGKERDEETGFDYFGARYYWTLGTWISVDPLAHKYPGISPYAYCGWNPIRFVDPDGMDWYSVSHDPDDCHATVWEELIYNEI